MPLKYADHVIILNKGTKYMEGKPEEVFVQQEALNKVQLRCSRNSNIS